MDFTGELISDTETNIKIILDSSNSGCNGDIGMLLCCTIHQILNRGRVGRGLSHNHELVWPIILWFKRNQAGLTDSGGKTMYQRYRHWLDDRGTGLTGERSINAGS